MLPDDHSRAGDRLAALVIVADDEEFIDDCLVSVSWADVIYAVDLGSTDGSREICAAHGLTPVTLEALPDVIAGGAAGWVLLVQGHEVVTSALREEIRALRAQAGRSPAGYRVARDVHFLGRRLHGPAGRAPHRVRLARRDALDWTAADALPHSLPVQGAAELLHGTLVARPGRTLQHYMRRMNMTSSSAADMRRRVGKTSGWLDLATVPLAHGLRTMPGTIIRDGMVGVIFAVLESYSIAVIRAKCWELQQARAAP